MATGPVHDPKKDEAVAAATEGDDLSISDAHFPPANPYVTKHFGDIAARIQAERTGLKNELRELSKNPEAKGAHEQEQKLTPEDDGYRFSDSAIDFLSNPVGSAGSTVLERGVERAFQIDDAANMALSLMGGGWYGFEDPGAKARTHLIRLGEAKQDALDLIDKAFDRNPFITRKEDGKFAPRSELPVEMEMYATALQWLKIVDPEKGKALGQLVDLQIEQGKKQEAGMFLEAGYGLTEKWNKTILPRQLEITDGVPDFSQSGPGMDTFVGLPTQTLDVDRAIGFYEIKLWSTYYHKKLEQMLKEIEEVPGSTEAQKAKARKDAFEKVWGSFEKNKDTLIKRTEDHLSNSVQLGIMYGMVPHQTLTSEVEWNALALIIQRRARAGGDDRIAQVMAEAHKSGAYPESGPQRIPDSTKETLGKATHEMEDEEINGLIKEFRETDEGKKVLEKAIAYYEQIHSFHQPYTGLLDALANTNRGESNSLKTVDEIKRAVAPWVELSDRVGVSITELGIAPEQVKELLENYLRENASHQFSPSVSRVYNGFFDRFGVLLP